MKPKDKAKDLIKQYCLLSYKGKEFEFEYYKKCALIAVEEVRWFHEKLFYLTKGSLFDKYLDDVKQEIEKL